MRLGIMTYKFFILCIYILMLGVYSCVYQSQDVAQQINHDATSEMPIISRQNESSNEWKKIEVPLGMSGEVISFNNKGHIAIAGMGSLLLSNNDGRTWQALNGGKGNDLYTTNGGITYHDSKNEEKNSNKSKLSSININKLCPTESMVFGPSDRLYIYSICEHHTQLWSVPINSISDSWYIHSFGPSLKQYERSDNPDYYTPRGNFVVIGERVLIDAFLPNGTSLMTTDDYGKKWHSFWHHNQASRIVGLDFINEQQGWMVLSDGKILRTVNGGRTWLHFSQLPPNVIGKISSLDFANEIKGFVVGEKGLILVTEDGGRTWQKQLSDTDNFLHKVAVATDKRAWIVGENATVLETEDGGKKWRKVELGIDDNKNLFADIYNLTIKEGKAWIIVDKFIYTSP